MTALIAASRDALREAMGQHFIMWRSLSRGGPRGEWFCECGLKFGFSDTAIDHQTDALLASGAVIDAATLADDEALVADLGYQLVDANADLADRMPPRDVLDDAEDDAQTIIRALTAVAATLADRSKP